MLTVRRVLSRRLSRQKTALLPADRLLGRCVLHEGPLFYWRRRSSRKRACVPPFSVGWGLIDTIQIYLGLFARLVWINPCYGASRESGASVSMSIDRRGKPSLKACPAMEPYLGSKDLTFEDTVYQDQAPSRLFPRCFRPLIELQPPTAIFQSL